MRKLGATWKSLWASTAVLVLAAACSPSGLPDPTLPPIIPTAEAADLTPTPLPLPTLPPSATTPTPSSVSPIQAQAGAIAFSSPVDSAVVPDDLIVIDAANVYRLVRYGALDQLVPDKDLATSGATLGLLAPDENRLAATFDEGHTIVWDMATGWVSFEQESTSDGNRFAGNPPLAVSFASQAYLATAKTIVTDGEIRSAGAVEVRSANRTEPTFILPADDPDVNGDTRVMSLAFSPAGLQLAIGIAGSERGAVHIWDVSDRSASLLLQEIPMDGAVSALQYTPDGSTLIAAAGDSLVDLNPSSGSELRRRAFEFPITGYSTSPAGEAFAAWGDRFAAIESPHLPAPLQIQAIGQIRGAAISPGGGLAVLADGLELRFWDLASGAELPSLNNEYPVLDVAFIEDGRAIATVDLGGRVLLWGVRDGSYLSQAREMISRENAPFLERAATLFVPGTYDVRFSSERSERTIRSANDLAIGSANRLVIGAAEGIHLIHLPSLLLHQLLPAGDRGHTTFDVATDGYDVAWISEPGVVSVWDQYWDTLDGEFPNQGEDCCWQVRLTPTGRYLLTLRDLTLRVWDTFNQREIYSRQEVQQVDVSPDGNQLAFQQGLDVNIMDLTTRREVQQLTGFSTASPIVTTKFSPTWNVMYWAGRASMQFVDVESGNLGPEVPFSWGEFSPWGDRIAAVESGWTMASVGQVHMIDVFSGETLAVFDHDEQAIVSAVAFSPDGKLLATALGSTIKIWDALSGEELATLPESGGAVHDLAFSPDRRMLMSRSEGDLIELWAVPWEHSAATVIRASTAESVVSVDSLRLAEGATDAVFSPDGSNIAISTQSGAIWYWDLATGQAVEGQKSHDDWIYELEYHPAGITLLSVSKDGEFREKRDPESSGFVGDDHVGEISGVAYFPNGETVVTTGQDGTLQFRPKAYLSSRLTIEAHPGWVWDVAVSLAGDLLATAGTDGSIKVWQVDLYSEEVPVVTLLHTLTEYTAAVQRLDFSPDGRSLVAAPRERDMFIWDTETGEIRTFLGSHGDWVYDVAFSPSGSLVASASADGDIGLAYAETGYLFNFLGDGEDPIRSVDFSSDGRYLVSASDSGLVQIWGVAP